MFNNKEYKRRWRLEHADISKSGRIKYRMNNREKLREYYRIKLYGINNAEYDELIKKQSNCCAICGIHQSFVKRVFAIDHNHETKNIRGILCHNCNIALGHFNDSIELLEKAKEYLKTRNN